MQQRAVAANLQAMQETAVLTALLLLPPLLPPLPPLQGPQGRGARQRQPAVKGVTLHAPAGAAGSSVYVSLSLIAA